MKTTIELPEELFREAKSKAALEGSSLKDLIAEGLRLRLKQAPSGPLKRVKFPVIESKSNRPLTIPDDIASRIEEAEDIQRYEASLR